MASTTSNSVTFLDGIPLSIPVYLTDPATGKPFSSTNALTVSATVTANVASNGLTGSAVPTSADFLGGSDGTNLQGLLVESSSHPNLRIALYNGATELGFDNTNEAKVSLYGKHSAAGDTPIATDASGNVGVNVQGTVPVSGTFWQTTQPVSVASLPALPANQSVNIAQQGGIATAMAGSDAQTAANVPLEATGTYNGTTVDRWHSDGTGKGQVSLYGKGSVAGDTALLLETLTALAGAGITEDIFRYAVLRAKAYTVSTGKQTASGAGNFPTQLLCSSISKNVLIVSIIVGGTTTGFTVQLNSITADSGWSSNTAITSDILNLSLGGAASSVTSVLYNTATQTLGGAATTLATYTAGANGTVELLQNGASILLPSSANNGIVVWNTPTGASTFHATIKWLEF